MTHCFQDVTGDGEFHMRCQLYFEPNGSTFFGRRYNIVLMWQEKNPDDGSMSRSFIPRLLNDRPAYVTEQRVRAPFVPEYLVSVP